MIWHSNIKVPKSMDTHAPFPILQYPIQLGQRIEPARAMEPVMEMLGPELTTTPELRRLWP